MTYKALFVIQLKKRKIVLSLLHDAIRNNDLDTIRALIRQGVDINALDKEGNRPAHLAAMQGNLKILEYLVHCGADINKLNSQFKTAFAVAVNRLPKLPLVSVITSALQHNYIDTIDNSSSQIVINKLITTLLYRLQRYSWKNADSRQIRFLIYSLEPKFLKFKEADFKQYITKQETDTNEFYGSYLSDDSDSDDEDFYDPDLNQKIIKKSEKYKNRAQYSQLFYTRRTGNHARGELKQNEEASVVYNLQERTKIYYSTKTDLFQVEADLAKLNALIAQGRKLQDAQDQVATKFYVAQYRGITYLTSKWNQQSRRSHRQDNEVGKAQYSSSVLAEQGIEIYRDYDQAKRLIIEKNEKLEQAAKTLHEILLTLREPRPCTFGGYSYSNLAYLLQNIYTQDYDHFHQIIKTDPLLSSVLLNTYNPHISTGDTPYHAMKYASGIKPYKNHENERLRPRWKQNGKAERPYSGVTYTSLHPITDYDNNGPLHLISLNRKGEVKIKNELTIIAERESCFPAYIPENRIIHKQVVKYPSFKKIYKEIYLLKYGIDEQFYYKLKELRDKASPHSEAMTRFKKLLGEWLCSFHEVRLIDFARKEAQRRNGVLVYRNADGGFSFMPPIDSVNRHHNDMTEAIKNPIKEKQKFRAEVGASSSQPKSIRIVSRLEDIDNIMDEITDLNVDIEEGVSIFSDGNHALDLPLAIVLNAVREKRYLALEKLLSSPEFTKKLKQTTMTSQLLNASPLHLAVLLDDAVAVKILADCKDLPIYYSDETHTRDVRQFFIYEKISPLAYAIILNSKPLVDILLNSGRFELTETVTVVYNKDLLEEELTMSPYPGDTDSIIGYGYASREYFPIMRIINHGLMHLAVELENITMVKTLLKAGFPCNLENANKTTPLEIAMKGAQFKICYLLLKSGAKPDNSLCKNFFDNILPERYRKDAANLTRFSFVIPKGMPEPLFHTIVQLKKHFKTPEPPKPTCSSSRLFKPRRKPPAPGSFGQDIRRFFN